MQNNFFHTNDNDDEDEDDMPAFEKGKELIDKLAEQHVLTKEEFVSLLKTKDEHLYEYLSFLAQKTAGHYYGRRIYIRGLIEFTNYCKNDCYYCGIRKSNGNAVRYRLTDEQIFAVCRAGYDIGFRTYVLQGGEDCSYTQEHICFLIKRIKNRYPDCAVTLSIGEKSKEDYEAYFRAGADRFLLRQETVDPDLFSRLKPPELTAANRKKCIRNLKKIGFQTGCGFMVGAPYQTFENIADDLLFIHDVQPEMIGIGPFIPHHDTPFKDMPRGSVELTLFLLGILRLIVPNALIPATTALGTADPKGREKGVLSGANVIMPNLSPPDVRKMYELYDNKIYSGDEAAEGLSHLKESMKKIGYEVVVDRGDCAKL